MMIIIMTTSYTAAIYNVAEILLHTNGPTDKAILEVGYTFSDWSWNWGLGKGQTCPTFIFSLSLT